MSTSHATVPDAPSPDLLYRYRIELGADLAHLWRERALVRTIAERDIRSRYKQLFLGWAWSIITPFISVVAFTYFFRRIGKIDSGHSPYPLFIYVGVLSWNLFSSSVSNGASSLLTNSSILNKLYLPREIFPLSGVVVTCVDTMLATVAFGALMVVYHVGPRSTSVWLPLLFAIELTFVIGITMAFSTMMIYLRDLRLVLAGVLQAGFFLTPVAFNMTAIPTRFRVLYCAVNPMAAVIDSMRRVVLWGQQPNWHLMTPAAVTSIVALFAGYLIFRRLEGGIADVA